MNLSMISYGTGTGTSRNSRIPVTSIAVGIRRSKSARNEETRLLRHRSNDGGSHKIPPGNNRPVSTATRELEIRQRRIKDADASRRRLTTSRPFSVESSPSSLSSSAMEDSTLQPPVNEGLNAAMEKLFELYRRQERRGSLGGSDTDASLSGGGGGMGSGGGEKRGGEDATAEDELSTSSGRVRNRRKRRISVRRSKSSTVDKSKSFSHNSFQSSSAGYNQAIQKDRFNTTQDRLGRHAESSLRDHRVVTYEVDRLRAPRKFVPPKATGVVLGPRSRSCGLTKHGSQRETSSSRYPDAVNRAHPRTRSHEPFRSTGRGGQRPGAQWNQQDAGGTGRGTSELSAPYEPRRSRYETHRMRNTVAEDIPRGDSVDSRRNQGTDLYRSAGTRGPYRSDEVLNRNAVRKAPQVDGMRPDARPTGSMSKIPLATTKKMLTGMEQSGSGSDSEADARSRAALRKGHRNEAMGEALDPGTILISNRSLWFVDRRHRSHPPRIEQVALPAGLDHLVRSIMLKHLLQPKSTSGNNNNTSDNSNGSNDTNGRDVSSSGQ